MFLRALALAAALLFAAGTASAQTTGVMLVARPSIVDPNFARTVIVVAMLPDGASLGVIVNRPLRQSLADLLPNQPDLARFKEPMRVGGPVEREGLFALYVAPSPVGESFNVGGGLQLALMPPDVEKLLHAPPVKIRFFAGYAGWGPGQLAREIERGDWWVLDPDVDIAFRDDTRGLWDELRNRSSQIRARLAY
jgi:putative transcriptional regulator